MTTQDADPPGAAEHAELMARMLAKTGIDDVEIDGRTEETLLDAGFAACLACTDVEHCRTWLADPRSRSLPEFCANRELFARILDGSA